MGTPTNGSGLHPDFKSNPAATVGPTSAVWCWSAFFKRHSSFILGFFAFSVNHYWQRFIFWGHQQIHLRDLIRGWGGGGLYMYAAAVQVLNINLHHYRIHNQDLIAWSAVNEGLFSVMRNWKVTSPGPRCVSLYLHLTSVESCWDQTCVVKSESGLRGHLAVCSMKHLTLTMFNTGIGQCYNLIFRKHQHHKTSSTLSPVVSFLWLLFRNWFCSHLDNRILS